MYVTHRVCVSPIVMWVCVAQSSKAYHTRFMFRELDRSRNGTISVREFLQLKSVMSLKSVLPPRTPHAHRGGVVVSCTRRVRGYVRDGMADGPPCAGSRFQRVKVAEPSDDDVSAFRRSVAWHQQRHATAVAVRLPFRVPASILHAVLTAGYRVARRLCRRLLRSTAFWVVVNAAALGTIVTALLWGLKLQINFDDCYEAKVRVRV